MARSGPAEECLSVEARTGESKMRVIMDATVLKILNRRKIFRRRNFNYPIAPALE
jgi:hypothetical protein